ncbi:MAG TPA: hypothetical protein VHX87_01080 [Galbitalea sp.]|jgi:hypothetical protein|nr:hypothetical protein [Galbitalea sp.]
MSPRLGSVLSARDLPAPELGALVLDGEAYRLGDCFASIDQTSGPFLRAAALTRELPARLIAEQHTAAWVWGAVARPPARHEVCADTGARTRPAFEARLSVREVVILHDDITVLAGTAVTIPMRTAIDLARFVETWSDEETRIVRELLTIARCTVLDCARAMNRKRNLPNKKIALQRLALCVG